MRFFLHIPVALILLFLAAVALTIYLVAQTTVMHRAINLLLAEYIEAKYHVKIDYADIGGSLTEYLTINNVRVDFETAPNRYRLVKIKRVEAYYNINNLWHGVWNLDSLIIDEPTLVLRSDSSGKLLIPQFAGQDEEKEEQRPTLNLTIERLRLINGRFQWFRFPEAYYIDSINFLGAGSVRDGIAKVEVDSLALNYPQKNFRIGDLRLHLALSNGTIEIDSLYLATDSSRLQGGVVFPLDKSVPYSLSLQNSHISFAELSHVIGINLIGDIDFTLQAQGHQAEFAGNADLDGTLFGRRIGPLNSDYSYADGILSFTNLIGEAFDGQVAGSIDLNLMARPETFGGTLQVHDVNLDKIVPHTFKSRINGLLQVNGSGMGANNFDIDLDVKCGRGSFDFVNYDSLAGTLSLNINDMYFHPGFSLYYKHSNFTAEGVVSYSGEMLLNGDFTTTQLADFWGDLFIKQLSGGGRGTYVVSGWNQDPDIRGTFEGDSCSFYGFATDSLRAEFDIRSFLYRRQGEVAVKAWRSDVWSLPVESLLVGIDIDSDLVTINRATLYHQRYLLDARGDAVIHDSTASVEADGLTLSFDSLRYVSVDPVPIKFLADRIVVDNLKLKGNEGEVKIRCDYGYDSTIALTVTSDAFRFAPWLRDLGYDTLLTGTASFSGTMTGKMRNPMIALKGSIAHLAYGSDSLGDLETDLRFSDSVLTFNDLTLHFNGGSLTTAGRFPLIMNLDSGIVRIPQQPMELTLSSSGNDLSILSSVNEYLESFTGDYQLKLDVYGTPQQPQTRGFFNLKNGTLKAYQMENPIENIEAQIKSQDKLVTVEWVEGKARYKGHEGIVRAAGEITIKSKDVFDYDLDVVGFDVPFKYDLGDIYGRCDFDLNVRGYNPPTVNGNVLVKEATFLDEFETPEVTAAIEAADTSAIWDYTVKMEMLPGSVTVKNSDVNMVLGGSLNVLRQSAHDNYTGTLDIVRGNSYLFDLNFRIEDGSQIIFDNIEQPNPRLDIKVSTRVRNYAGVVSGSGYDRLDLVIGGTLLEPLINTAEGSTYSNEDIATVILANQPATGGQGEPLGGSAFQNRIRVGTAGYLAARTSQVLSRTFGVELFEIAPVYSEKNTLQGASVSLGLYTLPNLYTYVSSLSIDGRADYGTEYRLGRHFYTSGSLDRDNHWRLNLNLNWEFK